MAGFDRTQYQLGAYTAPLIPKPVTVCTNKHHQSQVLPLVIDFVKVAPTFALQVNLNQSLPGQVLVGGVQGVFIDNSNNNSDLILYFPDTGYTVLCPIAQTRFFPIFSNTMIVQIYNGALANTLFTGATITVMFTNFLVNPFDSTALLGVTNFNLITSLTVGAGVGETQFAHGVLGDQHLDSIPSISSSGVSLLIGAPPLLQGVFIITKLQIAILNAYAQSGSIVCTFGIRYGTTGTTRLSIPLLVNSDAKYVPYTIIYSHDGGYLTLDATQTINAFFTGVPGAFLHYSFDFLWTTSQ